MFATRKAKPAGAKIVLQVVNKTGRQCLNYVTCQRKLSGDCPYWHPLDDCGKFPHCTSGAHTCPLAHPFCNYQSYCQCDQPINPQYNHRNKRVNPLLKILVRGVKDVSGSDAVVQYFRGIFNCLPVVSEWNPTYDFLVLELITPDNRDHVKKLLKKRTDYSLEGHQLFISFLPPLSRQLAVVSNFPAGWDVKDLENYIDALGVKHTGEIKLNGSKALLSFTSAIDDVSVKIAAWAKVATSLQVTVERVRMSDAAIISQLSDNCTKDQLLYPLTTAVSADAIRNVEVVGGGRYALVVFESCENVDKLPKSLLIGENKVVCQPYYDLFGLPIELQPTAPANVEKPKEMPKPIEIKFDLDPPVAKILQSTAGREKIAQMVESHSLKADWQLVNNQLIVQPGVEEEAKSLHSSILKLIWVNKAELPEDLKKIGVLPEELKMYLDRLKNEDTYGEAFQYEILGDGAVKYWVLSKWKSTVNSTVVAFMKKRAEIRKNAIMEALEMTTESESELVADPVWSKYLFAHSNRLDWWPDFQRKYKIVSGKGKWLINATKTQTAEATGLVKTNLKAIAKDNFAVNKVFEDVFTDERLRQIEAKSATLIERRKTLTAAVSPSVTVAVPTVMSSAAVSRRSISVGSIRLEVVCGNISVETTDVVVCIVDGSFGLSSQVAKAIEAEYCRTGGSPGQLHQLALQANLRTDSFSLVPVAHMNCKAIGFHVSHGTESWSAHMVKLLVACNAQKYQSVSLPAIGTGLAKGSMDGMVDQLWLTVTQFAGTFPSFTNMIRLVIFEDKLMAEVWQKLLNVSKTQPNKQALSRQPKAKLTELMITYDIYGQAKHVAEAKKQLKMLIDHTETVSMPELTELSADEVDEIKALGLSVHLSLTLNDDVVTVKGSQDHINTFLSQSLPEYLIKRMKEQMKINSAKQPRHSLPSEWISDVNFKGFQKVTVVPNSPEYQQIVAQLARGNFRGANVSIERIENPTRYLQYLIQKSCVEAKLQSTGIQVERHLFHGTASSNIDAICQEGFNRSCSGINGTSLGHGTYFSSDFNYSLGYCAGGKKMFFCAVLTGRYQQGNSGMRVLDKVSGTNDKFDSVVNSTSSPSMFVTFNDNSAYPSHLITFA